MTIKKATGKGGFQSLQSCGLVKSFHLWGPRLRFGLFVGFGYLVFFETPEFFSLP